MQVLSFSPPPVDRREILRYAGCRQPGPAEMDLLESCLAELGDRLRCQVCWNTFPVSLVVDGLDWALPGRTRKT